jgi:hypothetical protein
MNHRSTRTGRGSVVGRLAGTAVATALFLGVPALATVTAAPASAATTLVDRIITTNCPGNTPGGDCDYVTAQFTVTDQERLVSMNVTLGVGSYCARGIAFVDVDGQDMGSQRVGKDWQQAPIVRRLAPGNHTIRVNFRSLSDCVDGAGTQLAGGLKIEASTPPVADIGRKKVDVIADTNVFDKPEDQGGKAIEVDGQVLFLDDETDTAVLMGECTKQTWCIVKNDRIPGDTHTGAVWGGHLDVPAA